MLDRTVLNPIYLDKNWQTQIPVRLLELSCKSTLTSTFGPFGERSEKSGSSGKLNPIADHSVTIHGIPRIDPSWIFPRSSQVGIPDRRSSRESRKISKINLALFVDFIYHNYYNNIIILIKVVIIPHISPPDSMTSNRQVLRSLRTRLGRCAPRGSVTEPSLCCFQYRLMTAWSPKSLSWTQLLSSSPYPFQRTRYL